jgi:hypothetical protein
MLIQPPFSEGKKGEKETGSDGCLIFKIQRLGPEDPWTYAT